MQTADNKNELKSGTFNVGDLQEHRYSNPHNWVEGKVPHSEHAARENIHKLVYDRFDPTQMRFKSELEWRVDRERELERHLQEQANKPAFKVPDSMIDDWTG